MKIAENNVKCGEIIILDHKLYLKTTNCSSNFVRMPVEILSKDFFPRVGFLNKNLVALGSAREGMVTGHGDTCINILLHKFFIFQKL